MVYQNCATPSIENYKPFGKRKRKLDPAEKSDLEKRASILAQRLEANARKYSTKQANDIAKAARQKQYYDDLFMRRMAKLEHLNPRAADRASAWIANNFNQKGKALGLDPSLKYSTPGEVRYSMQQSRRLAEGFIEEVGKYGAVRDIRKIVREIKGMVKGKNLPFESVDELIQAAIEVGQIPAKRGAYGIGVNGDAYLMAMYDDFVELLKGHGFSKPEIDALVDQAARISDNLAEVRAVGNAFGLNIGDLQGLGYFERVMTDVGNRFVKEIKSADELLASFKPNNAVGDGALKFQAALEKSRKTFKYIPEDEALLAYMLGKEIDELRPILADPKELTKFLHNNLSDDQLKQLVDMGVASKIPMTTPEVFDYFVKEFDDLPFKGMSEMFRTNPTEVAEYYVQNLKKSAGQSSMLRTIFKDGISAGWAVSAEDVFKNPSEFKGFKQIDADIIKNFVPEFTGKGNVYVHPIVADSWKAIVDVATDPAKLGTFAGTIKYVGSMLTQSLLMTPQYALRILYSSFVATSAAGGNLLRAPGALFDMFKVGVGGLDVLDDVAPAFTVGGRQYTKRQLFKEFIRFRSQEFNPGMLDRNNFNPREILRAVQNPGGQLNYWWQYTQAFGGAKGAEYFADLVKGTQSAFFKPFAALGSFLETGMKWSTLMSITDKNPLNQVGQFASSLGQFPRNFDSMDSVFRHIDEYFYAFDDVGRVTSGVSRYVRPFAVYAMNNPPAVIRHAMRNPEPFINYWRIRSFINQDAANDEEINEATVPDYVSDSGALFFFKDKDVAVALLTNNYDPISEATSYINKVQRDITSLFGWYSGTSGQQRDQMEARGNLAKWVQEMFKETQPLYRNLAELVTGIDSATGKPITKDETLERQNFLGVRMNPVVKWALSSYPPAEALDRWNFAGTPLEGAFGEPAYIDPRTNKPFVDEQGRVYEGKPSWAGYERTAKQIDKYHPVNQKIALRPFRWAGFSVKVLDLAANAQWTYTDIERNMKEAQGDITRASRALSVDTTMDDKERARITNEIKVKADQWAQLRIDFERVKRYMAERGIPPNEMHRKVDSKLADQMPQISDKILADITKEYLEMQGIKEEN